MASISLLKEETQAELLGYVWTISAGARSREGSCESHELLDSGATAHGGCFYHLVQMLPQMSSALKDTEVAAESKTGKCPYLALHLLYSERAHSALLAVGVWQYRHPSPPARTASEHKQWSWMFVTASSKCFRTLQGEKYSSSLPLWQYLKPRKVRLLIWESAIKWHFWLKQHLSSILLSKMSLLNIFLFFCLI